ncbi:MAG: hypothetical protein ACLPX5_14435 [Dissulfurispiraceae bacterium]
MKANEFISQKAWGPPALFLSDSSRQLCSARGGGVTALAVLKNLAVPEVIVVLMDRDVSSRP